MKVVIVGGVVKQWHLDDLDKLPRDGSVTLLDTRNIGEYSRGYIYGSRMFPLTS